MSHRGLQDGRPDFLQAVLKLHPATNLLTCRHRHLIDVEAGLDILTHTCMCCRYALHSEHCSSGRLHFLHILAARPL